MRNPDVVIAGAGAIGLSCAWRLAQEGLEVVVADPRPESGASVVAAGLLAPVTEAHYGEEPLLELNLASARMFPDFIAKLEDSAGAPAGFRTTGTVVVARDADDNRALEELFRYQASLGLAVQRLRSREVRDLEPGLAPGVRGGIFVPGDHQVDPPMMIGALQRACERAGVRSLRESVRGISTDREGVVGAELDSGSISCGHLVVAAGSWTPSIEGLDPRIKRAIRPVKGQLVHLAGPPDRLPCDRNVRGLDVYILPRSDGRMVLGATMEERGFDATVTAGAVHDLLQAGAELLPDIAELDFMGARAGFRPATPDNAPMIGTAGIDRLVLATGHFRNGILLAPITADAVAELVSSGRPPDYLRPFSPLRFEAEERVGG